MRMNRLFRNLLTTRFALNRAFTSDVLEAIEAAVARAEALHGGEIRFAIEAALDARLLMRGVSARERALDVFSTLRVWDTAQNNGVLIYVLLAERDIELVADRGYSSLVSETEWDTVCADMQSAFSAGHYREGSLSGVEAVSTLIARHFPKKPADANELPDAPVVL